ncbi:MAG: hypothetical protein ACYTGZ_11110 [Planctomycetota bacterium]|jgi:hypothetical protein
MIRIGMTAVLLGLAAPLAAEGDADSALRRSLDSVVKLIKTSQADFDLSDQMERDRYKMRYMKAEQAPDELLRILGRRPEAWSWVRDGLSDFSRDPARHDAKRRQISVLAHDRDKETKKLLARELKRDPKCFDTRLLIAVDLGGVAGATPMLAKLASGKPSMATLPAAVHLGLRGMKEGRKTLDWAAKTASKKTFLGSLDYGAAIALKRLGNADLWKRVVERAQSDAQKALADGQFRAAGHHALRLEYFASIAKSRDPVDIYRLDRDAGMYAANGIAQIESEADVKRILKKSALA